VYLLINWQPSSTYNAKCCCYTLTDPPFCNNFWSLCLLFRIPHFETGEGMYNHNDHYLMLCILRSIALTIQKVCLGSPFYKYPRDVVVKTHRQKWLLSFLKEQLFVFNDKQSTQYHKKHSSLMNESFWTWTLCEWWRRENRWQNRLCIVFVV